ncbi:acyltransferase family protein [Myroides fluvii]|uniref:acyltransferase family protein n=1 Tax=Myroides fluvii TaxID=2572594 RepID=UPI00131AEE4F|nr:acyltransferase family protein [Myroides fluvii]
MQYRQDIQGLRALAVLFVFIFHLHPSGLGGGFIGVDIFFVISGFLVSSIILDKKEKGTFNLFDFYLGRIKRIMPIFLLFLAAVGFAGAMLYIWVDILHLRSSMLMAGLFNSNNYFAQLDTYFGASNQENPLLHTWTLSIEMQFYLLLPLFLLFIRRQLLFPVCMALVLVLLGYSFYASLYLNQQSEMYFSLLARIPEFLIGTIFALRAATIQAWMGNYQNSMAWIALGGIVICGMAFSEQTLFPGVWVVIPCLCTGILLLTTSTQVNALFSTRWMVHVGELSYAIYLWHWAIMAFVRYYTMETTFSVLQMIGITALTYALSWLSYTYVEKRYRTYSTRVFLPRFVGLGVLYLVAGAGIYRINQYAFPIPKVYASPTFGMESHDDTYVNAGPYGEVTPALDSIVLIGDSHALVYKAILDEIGKKNHFSFWSVTNDRYPIFPNIARGDFESESDYQQYIALRRAFEPIKKKSKLIFVASAWLEEVPSLATALTALVEELTPDQRLVILGDYPTLDQNPIRATRDFIYAEEDDDIQVVDSSEPQYVLEAIKANPNQVLYFQFDFSQAKTLPYFNDTLGYYDEGHLNAFGSKKMGALMEEEFMTFVKENDLID